MPNELHQAVAAGNVQKINELLAAGAKIDEPHTETKKTPIAHALQFGTLDSVRLLFERGASLDTQVIGEHPFHLVINNTNPVEAEKMKAFLTGSRSEFKGPYQAFNDGTTRAHAMLFQEQVDFDDPELVKADKFGRFPLYWLAIGQEKIIKDNIKFFDIFSILTGYFPPDENLEKLVADMATHRVIFTTLEQLFRNGRAVRALGLLYSYANLQLKTPIKHLPSEAALCCLKVLEVSIPNHHSATDYSNTPSGTIQAQKTLHGDIMATPPAVLIEHLEKAVDELIGLSQHEAKQTSETKEAIETKEPSKPINKNGDAFSKFYSGLTAKIAETIARYFKADLKLNLRVLTPRLSALIIKLAHASPYLVNNPKHMAQVHLTHAGVLAQVTPDKLQEIKKFIDGFDACCDTLIKQPEKFSVSEKDKHSLSYFINECAVDFQTNYPQIAIHLCNVALKFIAKNNFARRALMGFNILILGVNNDEHLCSSIKALFILADEAIKTNQASPSLYRVLDHTKTVLSKTRDQARLPGSIAAQMISFPMVLEKLQAAIQNTNQKSEEKVAVEDLIAGMEKVFLEETAEQPAWPKARAAGAGESKAVPSKVVTGKRKAADPGSASAGSAGAAGSAGDLDGDVSMKTGEEPAAKRQRTGPGPKKEGPELTAFVLR